MLDLTIRTKAFNGRTVLRDTRLQVASREVVAILGPSGSGKSTLLRIAAGLDREFEGSLTVGGAASVVFQEPRLMPWLNVADNVGFPLGHKKGWEPSVTRLLGEVGLAEAGSKYPKELSGGMAQRAAIARAFVTNPQLVFLDEPFSAVDAFTRSRLQDLLLTVAARHGATVLLVTHDIDEALYLSDRVVVLDGRGGTPSILAEHALSPRPRDRADGQMSHLKAEILRLLTPAEPLIAA